MDWLFGVVGLSVWAPIVFTIVTTQFTIVAITVYLHRHSAHRALELHPALKHVFRFWLWVSTGMSTKEWTAVHRKHHALTETEQDPHSPVIEGLGEILFKGVKYYRQGITPETMRVYGKGTPDDWLERNVYVTREFIGIGSLAALDLVLFGVTGILVWAVQMAWTPFWAAGVINGIGHAWGYRNFETPDHAKNIVPWAFFIGGEELHNNHHTYPNSPKLSVKKWEFDIGWMWIRIFEFFGLAKPNRVGPVVTKDMTKKELDVDSVIALINDRFAVMAKFGTSVVGPLVRAQYTANLTASPRRMLRRAKSLICRDDTVLSEADQKQLDEIKNRFPTLDTVHTLRVRLTEIWKQRTASKAEVYEALRDWTQQAESRLRELGHVDELQMFISELKYYATTKPART
ncbi:MAG: acyl-CoA desaturase [Gammaproteobacteria bacterium]|nr:acyl-CoA desaturase [Gammaproteobacteria bacterium]